MSWTIRLSSSALKQLGNVPRPHQEIIANAIDRMSADPFQGNVKPHKGKQWAGRYRKAIGDYRAIFTLNHQEKIIEISQILRRSEKTYR